MGPQPRRTTVPHPPPTWPCCGRKLTKSDSGQRVGPPKGVTGTGHQNLKPQITHLRGFKAESITDQQWDLRRLRSASRCLRSWPTRTAAGGPGHGDLRTPLGYMLSPTPWFLLSFLSIASVCRKSGDNTGPCANSPRPLQPGCTRPRRQISCAKREICPTVFLKSWWKRKEKSKLGRKKTGTFSETFPWGFLTGEPSLFVLGCPRSLQQPCPR
ncbi:uncharacterized protein LOC131486016 isoform X4 [Neofelis nebulosa]|uniref:uncharacterized protein LOC131486016 isoform X4 n=1 Tax=Neofelis nebulosa TaxID=61452 RepID=UPI00272DAB46|nr:uncharacterized protein LOC131486016 isoform X4 [Neofelis nebulosa]